MRRILLIDTDKAISCEEYTQFAGLFIYFLRCQNSYVASYAPIFPP